MQSFDVGKKIDKGFSPANSFQEFPIVFETKFKNEGNTHLKPIGKIELVDEKGEVLKNIGKETIISP